MKRLFLLSLIITTAVVLYNCDDAGVTKTAETTYQVTGTINGWSSGSDKVLKAVVTDPGNNIFLADSTSISSTGDFTLNLKTPPDNFLSAYAISDPPGYTCSGTVTINPSSLKYVSVALDVYDAANARIGGLMKKNFTGSVPSTGSYILSYIYLDNNATISGNRLCWNSTQTDSVRALGNYTGNKGWNPIINLWNTVRITPTNPPTSYWELQITGLEPPGGLWYMQ